MSTEIVRTNTRNSIGAGVPDQKGSEHLALLWPRRDLISMDWKRCCWKDEGKAASWQNEERFGPRTISSTFLIGQCPLVSLVTCLGDASVIHLVIFNPVLPAPLATLSHVTSLWLDNVLDRLGGGVVAEGYLFWARKLQGKKWEWIFMTVIGESTQEV